MTPEISVILPTYNQAEYLAGALESILAQTYTDFELIVVNDGSTDHTAQVLERYKKHENIKIIYQENLKLPRALNTGFAQAQGKYFTWTSSDNLLLPNMLEVLVEELQKMPHIGLVYSDRVIIDADGNSLGVFHTPEYDRQLLLHFNIIHCSFLFRRECYQRIGGYDPEFIYSEDWEYWVRMSRFFSMKHVAKTLYQYRIHTHSMTGDIVNGIAETKGFDHFSQMMKKRYPVDWWIGKLKWWLIRATNKDHPLVKVKQDWQSLIQNAAPEKR